MHCALALAGLLLASTSGAVPLPAEDKLTAARLVEAFLSNEAYADENYVDKQVEITGKVVRVKRSTSGALNRGIEYVLELELDGAGVGRGADVELLIFFDQKDRTQLAKLKPGMTVVVRGLCGKLVVWAAAPKAAAPKTRERDYCQVHLRESTLVEGK